MITPLALSTLTGETLGSKIYALMQIPFCYIYIFKPRTDFVSNLQENESRRDFSKTQYDLTRFNKIVIQATAQISADNAAVN